jgi:cytochrome c oxidase cbb3-type subunit 3
MRSGARTLLILALATATAGCGSEARTVGPEQPMTPPASGDDPRITFYQGNVSQVAQGGRYFGWYGCGGCHTLEATGVLDLKDGLWRYGGGFDQVYRAISDGHGDMRWGTRIPVQQLWQITAYVRDLPKQKPERSRRQTMDQQGEPTGSTWNGALR